VLPFYEEEPDEYTYGYRDNVPLPDTLVSFSEIRGSCSLVSGTIDGIYFFRDTWNTYKNISLNLTKSANYKVMIIHFKIMNIECIVNATFNHSVNPSNQQLYILLI
jgi:hypothetical protein